MKALILAPLLMALALVSCSGRPSFVPTTRHLYASFTPLREPRPEVPVGALWVNGYGATGVGAAADNVITVRSLSGVNFDGEFQASLTAGLLKFLDLDPSYRQKVLVRFTDLSVVRVKDMSLLTEPPGHPRIYEALKAGTITISAERSAGLDVENRATSQNLPVFSRGSSGVSRTFSIDGKDLFFAIRVATLKPVESGRKTASLQPGKDIALKMGSYSLALRAPQTLAHEANCSTPAHLEYRLTYQLETDAESAPTNLALDKKGEGKIALPMPLSDGHGGLLSQLDVRVSTSGKTATCSTETVSLNLSGTRIETFRNPSASDW